MTTTCKAKRFILVFVLLPAMVQWVQEARWVQGVQGVQEVQEVQKVQEVQWDHSNDYLPLSSPFLFLKISHPHLTHAHA